MTPQSKGGQKLKKQTIECYKAHSITQKNSLYVALLLLEFKDEL